MPHWKVCEPATETQWQAYYQLRWQVLRKPWSQPPGSERDELESNSTHRIVIWENQVIGAGRLHRTDINTAQIRYMTVHPQFQGKGVGSTILKALEADFLENRIKLKDRMEGMQACDNHINVRQRILLHSRESAVAFYLKHGYQVVKPSHILYGEIVHFLMQKAIG